MFDIKISGTGIYLPPRVETSEELVTKINKPVDWIHQKAGVFERRVSDIDVDKMGAIAGKEALNNGPPPDLIINASAFQNKPYLIHQLFFKRSWDLMSAIIQHPLHMPIFHCCITHSEQSDTIKVLQTYFNYFL